MGQLFVRQEILLCYSYTRVHRSGQLYKGWARCRRQAHMEWRLLVTGHIMLFFAYVFGTRTNLFFAFYEELGREYLDFRSTMVDLSFMDSV